MNEERRLMYHWRLFIAHSYLMPHKMYHSTDFEQCMQKDYIISGETR